MSKKQTARPDRQSGTGYGQKDTQKREGGGQAQWGSNSDAIKDATKQHDDPSAPQGKRRKRGSKDPENLGDINDPQQTEIKDQVRYDDYMKKEKKGATTLYDNRTVQSDFKKKYKPTKAEKETDALFGGVQKKGKKRNRKSRNKKNKLTPQVYYERPNEGGGGGGNRGRPRGGGRGGGYNRGRGRDYQSQRRGGGGYGGGRGGRGGGYGGGGYGGYNNRRGGGGFFSRGRGTQNMEYNNDQSYQNRNEYAKPNNNNNPPQNNTASNTNNVNIPVNVTTN